MNAQRYEIHKGKLKHRLTNTGKNSDHFGPCECCQKRTGAEFWILTRFKRIRHAGVNLGWAHKGNLFICNDCRLTHTDKEPSQ